MNQQILVFQVGGPFVLQEGARMGQVIFSTGARQYALPFDVVGHLEEFVTAVARHQGFSGDTGRIRETLRSQLVVLAKRFEEPNMAVSTLDDLAGVFARQIQPSSRVAVSAG
ncbi:MAG TPA: hypothetical protein PLV72_04185 [Candidatus Magasanikbacteria bacterium]|nr:hypothetical protein [Candidatus Magasanikbacteria bacterium]